MIDDLNKTTLAAMIKLHRNELRLYEGVLAHDVNCRRCIDGGSGQPLVCRKWQQPVPEDVQKIGCNDWTFDAVPF